MKNEFKTKIQTMKDQHMSHIEMAKGNQAKMELEEERVRNQYINHAKGDLTEIIPKLKQEFKDVVHKSKEFRYIRQTLYYQ